MGAEISSIEPDRMPSYYVEDPEVTPQTVEIIDCSLEGVAGRNLMKTNNLKFSKFQQVFFKKLNELEQKHMEESVVEHFGSRLKARRLFLVRLMNIVATAPENQMDSKLNGKWKSQPRSELKKFFRDHKQIKLESYGRIGEVLLYSISECDEAFTKYVHESWAIGYSLFLAQFIPIALKFYKKIKLRDDIDLSGTDSLEFSNPSDSDDRAQKKRLSARHKRASNLRKQIAKTRMAKMQSSKRLDSFIPSSDKNPVKICRSVSLNTLDITDDDQQFLNRLSNPGKGKRRKWSIASTGSGSESGGSGCDSASSFESNTSLTSENLPLNASTARGDLESATNGAVGVEDANKPGMESQQPTKVPESGVVASVQDS